MKIAIVRRNGLGDLLAVMPLVKLCKEKYPGCHLTLFVDQRNKSLVPYLSGIDEVIAIEGSKNKYVSLIKTLWKNRGRAFDLVISARPTPMRWLNLFLAGLKAKKRLAVVDGGWDARWIDEKRAFDPKSRRHQMVKSLRLLDDSLEEVPDHLIPVLKVRPNREFKSKTLLVSVSNHRKGSQLDAHKIARHLNTAFEKISFQVVINCELKDIKTAQEVAELLQMKHEVILTEGFDEFMGLLASVDGSWTGDGGIMHLMAAMGKPQLVLFGRTPLWEWAPLSEKAICIWHPENVNLIGDAEIQQGLEELLDGLR